MTCTNQTDVSEHTWTSWEKLTFDQIFISEHQIFSFENCCLGKKRRSKVAQTFRKFGGWGQKPSVINLSHKHLVTLLLQTLFGEFPWKMYDCSMSRYFAVTIFWAPEFGHPYCCYTSTKILLNTSVF